MATRIHRRRFIHSSVTLSLAALLPVRLRAAFDRIDGIPRSPFGAESTADEVLAGIDLTGQTAVITGVNSGIGYESMKALAGHGAHVIGAARTMEKAETACNSVEGKTTPVVCELTEFATIVACAKTVRAMNVPVDILMCNAGIMALPELEQINGIEKQFVVNHLGHYILTRRLIDRVAAAPEGRVVMVSSIGYKNAPEAGIEFDNLSWERDYKPFTAYGQTKLANALFAFELARRYAPTVLTANAVHPGMVATNLGQYFMKKPRDPDAPLRPGFKTPAQGAATQVYVAAHPNLEGVSGYYFEDCNPVMPEGNHMGDERLAGELWDRSEKLTAAYLA
jgi:NAD(P)-dependent dehydrogenase (short-subunit alcohol dehydrogenase family)